MDCSEVLEQLGDYLDDDARAELCQAIEAHLAHCRDCRLEVDSVRRMIVLYQADRETAMPPSVASRLDAVLAREYANRTESTAGD